MAANEEQEYRGLVSQMEPEPIDVPGMPGHTMSFRPLSGKRIRKARGAAAAEYLEDVGAEAFKAFQPSEEERARIMKQAEEEKKTDPLSGFSDTILLRFGLVAWSGAKFEGVEIKGEPNDPDKAKDDLDEETREWAALQVARISNILEGEEQSSEAGGGSALGANEKQTERSSAAA